MMSFRRSRYFREILAFSVAIIFPMLQAHFFHNNFGMPDTISIIGVGVILLLRSIVIFFSIHYPDASEKIMLLGYSFIFIIFGTIIYQIDITTQVTQVSAALFSIGTYHIFIWILLWQRDKKKLLSTKILPNS